MEPLLHTAEVLNVDVLYAAVFKNLIDFLRTIPIQERINRKIEKALASNICPNQSSNEKAWL